MEQATQTSPAVRFDSRLWGVLLLLCGVLFLDGMDVSMVAVALPNIGHELDLGNSSLQWIVSGYVLGYGGLLLLGGRAADLIGRRKVLLGGLAVFVVASFIGGIANDGHALLIDQFVQGGAAGVQAPRRAAVIHPKVAAEAAGDNE